MDFDAATLDEIKCQTGLKPVNVQPSRHDSDELLAKTLMRLSRNQRNRIWTLFRTSSQMILSLRTTGFLPNEDVRQV